MLRLQCGGVDAKVPIYAGGKFPFSTYLAEQVRGMLADPDRWKALPEQVSDWLRLQKGKVVLPRKEDLLVETLPRAPTASTWSSMPSKAASHIRRSACCLTRRLERAGAHPTGFVATDYSLAVWGLEDLGAMFRKKQPSLGALFDEDMLGDDLDALAGGELAAETDVPQLRADLRPDRETPPRTGKKRTSGHRLGRSDLRRPAQS